MKEPCECGRMWKDHEMVPCHGGIVCGGYVEHNCATPGCREPEDGIHGDGCPRVLAVLTPECYAS